MNTGMNDNVNILEEFIEFFSDCILILSSGIVEPKLEYLEVRDFVSPVLKF